MCTNCCLGAMSSLVANLKFLLNLIGVSFVQAVILPQKSCRQEIFSWPLYVHTFPRIANIYIEEIGHSTMTNRIKGGTDAPKSKTKINSYSIMDAKEKTWLRREHKKAKPMVTFRRGLSNVQRQISSMVMTVNKLNKAINGSNKTKNIENIFCRKSASKEVQIKMTVCKDHLCKKLTMRVSIEGSYGQLDHFWKLQN